MSLMDTASNVTIDKQHARELLKQYREAKGPATDEDRAIMVAYREIARGRVIIQAAESIRLAGRDDDGLPKLAMARADLTRVYCSSELERVEFSAATPRGSSSYRACFCVDRMPPPATHPRRWRGIATVPLIPLPHRPKAKASNYWILFEADWTRAPVDPLLLRRLEGDLWLVLAAWELTAVERAVLEQRVRA